jgi:hypothetical protein
MACPTLSAGAFGRYFTKSVVIGPVTLRFSAEAMDADTAADG